MYIWFESIYLSSLLVVLKKTAEDLLIKFCWMYFLFTANKLFQIYERT